MFYHPLFWLLAALFFFKLAVSCLQSSTLIQYCERANISSFWQLGPEPKLILPNAVISEESKTQCSHLKGQTRKTTSCWQFHVPVCQKAQCEHSPHASHYCVVMTSSKLTRNQRLWPLPDGSESVLKSRSFHHKDKPWEAKILETNAKTILQLIFKGKMCVQKITLKIRKKVANLDKKGDVTRFKKQTKKQY